MLNSPFETAFDIIARRSLAHREAVSLQGRHAFNIDGASSRRKLNQHATLYRFPDGSRLLVTSKGARAESIDESGLRIFTATHRANTRA